MIDMITGEELTATGELRASEASFGGHEIGRAVILGR
jgi:hypothetical protein